MTTAEKLRELGRQEGRQEGEAHGRASTLLKQLRLKFGDVPKAVVARVELATIEELDRWAERILDAPSIDDTLR